MKPEGWQAGLLVSAVALGALGGCGSAVAGDGSTPAKAAFDRPKASRLPDHAGLRLAAGHRFLLLPDPDRLYGCDRVLVTRGGDVVQTLSLAQDRWVQSEEGLRGSSFSLFDIDRDGEKDLVLWSERDSSVRLTAWRFETGQGRFSPQPTVYHVRERTAPVAAGRPGAGLSALLLAELGDPGADGAPPEEEATLSTPILVHRDGHIVDFIESDRWLTADGVSVELGGGGEDTPFVDANFDGHQDLVLSSGSCSGNCYFGFWLFDPKTGRFEEHAGLSSLASPTVDAKVGQIHSFHSRGLAGALHTETRYRFTGQEMEKVLEAEQADDARAPGKRGGVPTTDVFHRTVRALRDGTMQVICEAFVNHETNEVVTLVRGDRTACEIDEHR